MATAKKTASGKWWIQIEVKGVRESGTFHTKTEALAWRDRRSAEIRAMKAGRAGNVKTLRDAMRRYAEEVSPTKRGELFEIKRLKAYESHAVLPVDKKIATITTPELAKWRDWRASITKPGSVLRDMALLGAVFETARREWQWIDINPMRDVKKPGIPYHRERLISGLEVRKMLRQLGYGEHVRTVTECVAVCFLLALATGMRAGELCAIRWADVSEHDVRLHTSKTGLGRNVPLSPVAKRLLEKMRDWSSNSVFDLRPQTLDALFRRARIRAGLSGFTFHDSRHNAATMLAPKMPVLSLCKVMGWTDPKRAMVYYNPSSKDLAKLMG